MLLEQQKILINSLIVRDEQGMSTKCLYEIWISSSNGEMTSAWRRYLAAIFPSILFFFTVEKGSNSSEFQWSANCRSLKVYQVVK
jgi:hypothetical protein